MGVQSFTIRDLEQARKCDRLRRREDQAELRNTAIALGVVAAVWMLREIWLQGWL